MANDLSVKQQIKRAFMHLMSEKPYAEITVTDIVNTAHVARVSYYRNFKSFDKILDSIVEEMTENYKYEVLPLLTGNDYQNWRTALRRYFERMLVTKSEFNAMLHANMQVIFTRVGSRLDELNPIVSDNTLVNKYHAAAKMGMVSSVARKWLELGAVETPDELTEFVMQYIIKLG